MDTSYLNTVLHTNAKPSECYYILNERTNTIQVIYENIKENYKENLGAIYLDQNNKIDKFRSTANKKFWKYALKNYV